MGLTYFGGNALLNYVYNDNDVLLGYDSFEIQLVDNNSAGYAGGRQSVLRGDDATFGNAWNINGNVVTNKNDIQFPPLGSSASTQTITKFNIFIDGVSGVTKELFASGTLNTPIVVQAGETPIIRAYDSSSGDGLEINIDTTSKYTQNFREKIYNYLFLAENSLTDVINYKFVVYDTSGNSTPLDFLVSRRGTFPNNTNWDVINLSDYAQAGNSNEIALQLNEFGNIVTNQLRFFYGEGVFPNETYTYAGLLDLWNLGTNQPFTYTINDGETGRFQIDYIRINSK